MKAWLDDCVLLGGSDGIYFLTQGSVDISNDNLKHTFQTCQLNSSDLKKVTLPSAGTMHKVLASTSQTEPCSMFEK